MKRALFCQAVLILVFSAAFVVWPRQQPSSPKVRPALPHPRPPASTVPPIAPDTAPPAIPADRATPPPATPDPRSAGSPLAADLNASTGRPQDDVEILHTLLRQYLHHLHHRQALPIGDDIDLARVLTGHNPMKLVILPTNHPALTADGHLRDRWGTPYFIHPRGNGAFEIRSAGPDRKLFTADDLIANPASVITAPEPE